MRLPVFAVLAIFLCVSACRPVSVKTENKNFLSPEQAEALGKSMYEEAQVRLKNEYGRQWQTRRLRLGELEMPFFAKTWGEKPANGYPLFISMHGGGGAPAEVNDGQYRNQQHLYDATMKSLSGIYIAPRAPTNNWNLWHESHIDEFFALIIRLAAAEEGVDLQRVYLLGYSAGGDGVYQLAPRLADRLAAASMMAGHPNDASPLSLRNLPFAIHMGALDAAYNRNGVAEQWGKILDSLQAADAKGGYVHTTTLHAGKGHWMELQDAVALKWMSEFKRNPLPERVVWAFDKQQHRQFYWLGVPANASAFSSAAIVEHQGQDIRVLQNSADTLYIYLNDRMLDLDKPVVCRIGAGAAQAVQAQRKAEHLQASLQAKGDPNLMFSARLVVVGDKVYAD